MRVAIRTDASLHIGSGHVMRCLTLADALKAQGVDCYFISRAHPGHMIEFIRQRNHTAAAIPAGQLSSASADDSVAQHAHAAWLDSTWRTDAQETAAVLARLQPDWLVVDHYALDQRWEKAVASHYKKLMVIDDLADRLHSCDLLLDQNLGRQAQDYASLVPTHCQVLTGPHFALLRPDFAALRPYSLQRRQDQPALHQLLITMGGVDEPNATGQVLQALKTCALPTNCRITVIMGLTALWLQNVQQLAAKMPWPTEVVVNVTDMAQRMADSDLAIGAAGSTSWERCCLALPTLLVVLADNQRAIATGLQRAGAAIALDLSKSDQFGRTLKNAVKQLADNEIDLMHLSQAAAKVTNGCGTNLVVGQMLGKHLL